MILCMPVDGEITSIRGVKIVQRRLLKKIRETTHLVNHKNNVFVIAISFFSFSHNFIQVLNFRSVHQTRIYETMREFLAYKENFI